MKNIKYSYLAVIGLILLIAVISYLLVFTIGNSSEQSVQTGITDAKIKLYKNKIDQDPYYYVNYNNLAQNYIQKARETGNSDYYKKAEKLLIKSTELNNNNYVTTVLQSKVAASNHKFDDAVIYAEKAISINPEKAFAYGTLGDVYLEYGKLDQSSSAYERMVEIKPGLDSYSRISNLQAERGNFQAAIMFMEKAYEAGLKESRSDENLAWTQVMLGLIYLKKNDLDNALYHYKKGLEIDPGYFLAMEHIAEIEALRGNYRQAERIYKEVIEINPAPEFITALVNVYENLGEYKKAEELRDKIN